MYYSRFTVLQITESIDYEQIENRMKYPRN